jgi:AAA+ superfamily predicted ATPase
MTSRPDLPGLDRARDILLATDKKNTDAIDDVLDGVDLHDPGLGARPEPRTPDKALDALMALRIAAVECEFAPGGPCPEPGTIIMLRAARERDCARLHGQIEELTRADRVEVRQMPGSANKLDLRQLETNVCRALLKGRGAVLIANTAANVPLELLPAVVHDIICPEVSAEMLSAVLSISHDAVVNVPSPLPDIGELQLASILAAACPDTALSALDRLREMEGADHEVTLNDIHGQPQAIDIFVQMTRDLDDWRTGEVAWSAVTSSFLLSGPPGTGKSYLAQAVAGSAKVHFVKTGYAECQRQGHQGDMLKALHDAADEAIANAPSVFFVDEIDSFYARSQSVNGYILGVVNGLLTLLDRLNQTPGVIVIAATNYPDKVDSAVIRAGRFDQHLTLGPLDRSGVRSMLSAELPADVATGTVLDRLGDQLIGMTGAQVTAILRDAATRARRARAPLGADHLLAAAKAVARPPDPDLLFRMAVHEAGHVLIGLPAAHGARLMPHGGEVQRPMPRLLTPDTVAAMIQTLLAGRAAEQIMLGTVSNGAGGGPASDLALATDLSVKAEVQHGLGQDLVWQPSDIASRLMPERLCHLVRDRLHDAEDATRRKLEAHRPDLERIARALIDARELDAAGLNGLLVHVRTRAQSDAAEAASETQM